jgi:hypothetical protein
MYVIEGWVLTRGGDRNTVQRCHEEALKSGANSNGSPGLRPHYHTTYYAAFMFDPVGNNIEVVCRTLSSADTKAIVKPDSE